VSARRSTVARVFVLGKPLHLNLTLESKDRAYPSEALFLGRLQTLLTNIRLAWKGLHGTNAPSYYNKS
jgi:hypothetical protein